MACQPGARAVYRQFYRVKVVPAGLDLLAGETEEILGSVYPFDPQIGSAWYSENYVLWKVKPGDIIVLHYYLARGIRTAKVLETMLPELLSRGYIFVTLTELSSLDGSRGKE